MHSVFGDFIRERRLHLNLTQEQLAERMGGAYTQSEISRLERGHIGLPRLSTIIRLAAAMEVSVGDVLIAGGWFEDDDIVASLTSATAEQDTLATVLAAIEAELDSIRDLEHQATVRSARLRMAVRQLATSMSNAGPGPCRDHVESGGVVSRVEG
jgi:transcriptional regulator with XRE-family HTH domain